MIQPAKVCSAGGELLNWHLLKEGARGQRSGIRERENASSASRSDASGFIRGKKEKFVKRWLGARYKTSIFNPLESIYGDSPNPGPLIPDPS
jgi:hypothetical protein